MFALKLVVWVGLGLGIVWYAAYYDSGSSVEERRNFYLQQFNNDDEVAEKIRQDYVQRNIAYLGASAGWVALGVLLFASDFTKVIKKLGI